MKNLKSYFENPFQEDRISLDAKKRFGEDHLARLAVKNTANQYDQLITDFTAAQTALFGEITNVNLQFSLQQAQTMSVDNIIKEFKTRNSKLNKFLEATSVADTVIEQFFAGGISEFTTGVNKGNAAQRMQHMISVITQNTAAAGGAAVLTEYNTFQTRYNTLRGQQLTKIGAVESGRSSRETAEAAWDDQLFENLLTIANLHRDQPQMVNDFFNQQIMQEDKNSAADGKGRYSGKITGTAGVNLTGAIAHVVDGNINDATSDGNGRYLTQNLNTGTYTITATKDGYQPFTAQVEVLDRGITTFNIVMTAL